jgi:sec-independent protein translocase protein TatB
MFNLDPGKLIVIAVVAIILLGPDKLPQVARQVGGAWRSFGEFRRRMESEVRSTMPDLPPTSEIARLARSPAALLHHLSTLSDDDEPAAPDATAGEEPAAGTDASAPAAAAALGTDGDTAPGTGTNGSALAADADTPRGTGTNGSAPAPAPAPVRPPSEAIVQADPNLN